MVHKAQRCWRNYLGKEGEDNWQMIIGRGCSAEHELKRYFEKHIRKRNCLMIPTLSTQFGNCIFLGEDGNYVTFNCQLHEDTRIDIRDEDSDRHRRPTTLAICSRSWRLCASQDKRSKGKLNAVGPALARVRQVRAEPPIWQPYPETSYQHKSCRSHCSRFSYVAVSSSQRSGSWHCHTCSQRPYVIGDLDRYHIYYYSGAPKVSGHLHF